jgi:3-(3-hydroxy-phenyl)propionate hydroxylase
VGAAWEIIDEAGKSTRFMTPPSRGFRLLRDAVLSLSLTEAFVRPLYHWRTSRPHEYTGSVLNSAGDDNALFQSGPAHGAPPANVRLGADDFLLDHLGGGFDLLVFGSTVPADVQAAVKAWQAKGLKLRVLLITPSGGSAPLRANDSAAGAASHNASAIHLSDTEGRARARWGVRTDGAAYLLRPDQHVCARWMTLDAHRLNAALKQATTGVAQ